MKQADKRYRELRSKVRTKGIRSLTAKERTEWNHEVFGLTEEQENMIASTFGLPKQVIDQITQSLSEKIEKDGIEALSEEDRHLWNNLDSLIRSEK